MFAAVEHEDSHHASHMTQSTLIQLWSSFIHPRKHERGALCWEVMRTSHNHLWRSPNMCPCLWTMVLLMWM